MTDYDEGGEFDGIQDEPRYLLLAREAEMFQEGGFNLTADPQRAGLTPSCDQNTWIKQPVVLFIHSFIYYQV